MARLLERSAPGVRAMARRSTMVVGVEESVGAASGVPETLMVSFAPAMLRAKCSTGSDEETTETFCCAWSKPTPTTVTTYSPRGTAGKAKLPLASEFAVADQSEDLALIMTMAFCTGRCWGSWMMPRTVATVAAKDGMAARHAAQNAMRSRRMGPPKAC